MPAVSVIMPVFNRAETIERAVRSVLDQTFTDFELIVIDDGSSDGSAALVEAIGDPRVTLIRFESNRGGNAARNAGILAATGPLISFLDSDDAFLPEKLATIVAMFAERPALDLIVDSFIKVLPPGSHPPQKVRRNAVIEDQETFLRALFTRRLWKATPAISARRAAIVRAGMFDETVKRMQDFDFLIRMAAAGQCASTDQVLWLKHWTPQSISAGDTWIESNLELTRRYPQYLTDQAYRPGLAYAVRLALARRFKSRQLAGAWSDLGQLAAAFGWRETLALLLESIRPRPKI
ncbi:MAG: glycosyltransferase [Sphingomicrobium sp.]